MTLELVLLLGLTVYLVVGAFIKDFGQSGVFDKSGPRLGARLERNLATGGGFTNSTKGAVEWVPPAAPNADLNEGNLK